MSPSLCRVPYVAQWHRVVDHLYQVLQECPLSELCVPSCCSRGQIVVVISVNGIDCQPVWLWDLVMPTPYELLCGG